MSAIKRYNRYTTVTSLWLTNLLPPWEGISRWATPAIPRLLGNLKVNRRVHRTLPLIHSLNRLSLHTSWGNAGGGEVQFHSFLTPTLDTREHSTSRSGRFTPRHRIAGNHSTPDCGPQSQSGGSGGEKSLASTGSRTPNRPAGSLVTMATWTQSTASDPVESTFRHYASSSCFPKKTAYMRLSSPYCATVYLVLYFTVVITSDVECRLRNVSSCTFSWTSRCNSLNNH
jgi:hypothetical protein